jgi:multiple sugar transport system substrate-binding protein
MTSSLNSFARYFRLLVLIVFLALLCAASLTTAVVWAAKIEHQTNIVFMDWWGPPRSEGYLEIIKAFEEENPDVKVEYLVGDINKALAMIAAGNAPDVLAVDQMQMSGALARGIARPLDDLIKRDNINLGKILLPGAVEGLTYQGCLYGLPKVYNPTHLYVNADLLEQTGLTIPQMGWTIQEFEDYLRKLTLVGGDGVVRRYGIKTPQIRQAGWLYINGGEYFDPVTGNAAITSPKITSVLDWISQLQEKGLSGPGSMDSFAKEGIAFFDEAWMTSVMPLMALDPGFKVHTVYLPRGEVSTVTFISIHPHLITAQSRHPEEAWRFLKFLNTSPVANEVRARYSMAPGTVSGMRQIVNAAVLPAGQSSDAVFGAFLRPSSLVVGLPRTTPGFSDAANQLIWPAMTRVISGTIAARSAMEEIIDSVNEVLRAARMETTH